MNKSQFDDDEIPVYKIIIVGKSHAGKTKLLARYKYGSYEDSGIITIGVDSHSVTTSKAKYRYYDTAGQDMYRAIVDSYYRGSDACIIAYDVTSMDSFSQIGYYYNKVKEMAPESLLFIVGCKADLQAEVSEQLVKKTYKGINQDLTSAKTNKNVKEFFASIQSELLQKKRKMKKSEMKQFSLFENRKSEQRGKCCKS